MVNAKIRLFTAPYKGSSLHWHDNQWDPDIQYLQSIEEGQLVQYEDYNYDLGVYTKVSGPR